MKRERRFRAGLTVRQPRELFAIAEHKLNLKTRAVPLHQLVTVSCQIGGGEDDVAWFIWGFPIDQDNHAQLPLERAMPDHRRL